MGKLLNYSGSQVYLTEVRMVVHSLDIMRIVLYRAHCRAGLVSVPQVSWRGDVAPPRSLSVPVVFLFPVRNLKAGLGKKRQRESTAVRCLL